MKSAIFLACLLFVVVLTNAQSESEPEERTSNFNTQNLFSAANAQVDTTTECYYEACPPGWVKQAWNKCFLLRPNPATRNNAETDCRQQGGSLGLVTSDSQRNFLNSLAFRDLPENTGLWLGAVRRGEHWFTSDLINFTYNTAWLPGEPDFSVGQCVYLNSSPDEIGSITRWGKLGMKRCDELLHYACQLDQYNYDRIVCQPRE
jgi:hypothetical protein